MKIVEIIPQFDRGGAERFVLDLSNELSRIGHKVTLIVFFSLDNLDHYGSELSSNVELIVLDKKRGFDFHIISELNRIFNEKQPDIIHSHLGAYNYLFIYSLLYKRNVAKMFHTVHNSAKEEAGSSINILLRNIGFRYITPVTISKTSLKSFIALYHKDAPLIENGRDIDDSFQNKNILSEANLYRKTGLTKVIIHLARMYKQKRHEIMAKVTKRLSDEGYDFAVLMIGETNEETLMKIKPDLCDSLHILGIKSNPLDYLKIADGFALCSSFEGLPISLIEALGCGCPAICTPVGGICDIIEDGVNGFLSNDLSEEAYYYAMKKFLDLDNLALEQMKKNALESYKPYTMKNCAEKYLRLFKGEIV